MKVEIDLPDDFLAWLDRQPLCENGCLRNAPVADKLRFLLQGEIDYFHEVLEDERHQALLRLLGVVHLVDVPDRDDDIPF